MFCDCFSVPYFSLFYCYFVWLFCFAWFDCVRCDLLLCVLLECCFGFAFRFVGVLFCLCRFVVGFKVYFEVIYNWMFALGCVTYALFCMFDLTFVWLIIFVFERLVFVLLFIVERFSIGWLANSNASWLLYGLCLLLNEFEVYWLRCLFVLSI